MNDAETSRWNTDEQINELAEMVPVGIIRTDPNGQCLYVNECFCRLTGLSREAASGSGWMKALPEEDRERVLRRWKRAASDCTEFAEEFRFERPGGDVRVVSSRAQPLFDRAGSVTGYLSAIADITERQQTQEALHRLSAELNERVKELNCLYGICEIVERSGGSLTYVLEESAKLLAASWHYPEVAYARIVVSELEATTDNYSPSPWKLSSYILIHGERVGFVEVGYLEERPVLDDGPFLGEERRLIDAVAARLGRVAARVRTEQLLQEREEELRTRLTHLTRVGVLGEMASSIAHELNQPLTAVATYAQAGSRMAKDGTLSDPEVLDILTRIRDEALRAGDIVHHMKDLVRKRVGKRAEWDINELVRDVERLAAVDARLHDVELRLELSESLPPVKVDGIQIQQVILNLIRNGIDALEGPDVEDGEVVVCTAMRGQGEVQVSVIDSGCGPPEEFEDKLLQPFFTTKEGGMGLGLSISRSIVLSHGGRIWFERNPDRGTTFHFTIPTPQG